MRMRISRNSGSSKSFSTKFLGISFLYPTQKVFYTVLIAEQSTFPCVSFSEGRKMSTHGEIVNIWGKWLYFYQLKVEQVSTHGDMGCNVVYVNTREHRLYFHLQSLFTTGMSFAGARSDTSAWIMMSGTGRP